MTVPVLSENIRLSWQSWQRCVMDLCLMFDCTLSLPQYGQKGRPANAAPRSMLSPLPRREHVRYLQQRQTLSECFTRCLISHLVPLSM